VDLRRSLTLVRRWLWLLVLGTLLAGGLTYLVSSRLPKVYTATTQLIVQSGVAAAPVADYNSLLTAQQVARTYSKLAESRVVLSSAAIRLGRPADDRTIAALEEAVSATLVRDTLFLQISAEAPTPQEAADIANAVAAALIVEVERQQRARFEAVSSGISEQLQQALAEVTAKQTALLAGNPEDRDRLARELAEAEANYAQFVRANTELRLAEARARDSLVVVDQAVPPAFPSRPTVLLNTLAASLVGLLICAGMAVLLEHLDDTLRTAQQVQQATGLLVLAAIRRFRPRSGKLLVFPTTPPGMSGQSPGRSSDEGPVEGYRLLRANLQLASIDQPLRTLLITSARPGEGETTTAANLAVALAQAGRRVLLLDADLRRPSLRPFFGAPAEVGLTSLLLDPRMAVEQAVFPTDVPSLAVVSSGPLPPNPVELLASRAMRVRLAELAAWADILIIDTSPLLACADALELAPQCDGVLLVVDSKVTGARTLRNTRGMLDQVGARVLGVVLNKVSAGSDHEFGYYRDYYYSPTPPSEGGNGHHPVGLPSGGEKRPKPS